MTTAAIIPVVNLKICSLREFGSGKRKKKGRQKKERKGAAAAVKLAKGVAYHQVLLLSILITLLSALGVSSYNCKR